MRPWAHERPREVGGPDSGGTDPVGNTEAARTAAGAQEYLSPVAGPVNWKGSKDALLGPTVTSLAYRRNPSSCPRPWSF
jgi:hypothetical protein